MPSRAPSRCPRCRQLKGPDGQCSPRCRSQVRGQSRRTRGSSTRQGYGHEHRELFRKPVLERDPVCVLCGAAPSKHADHWPLSRKDLVVRGLDPNDPRYGRGLCHACHSRETANTPGQQGGWNQRPGRGSGSPI